MNNKLSEHFTLDQMIKSNTATRLNINNTPDQKSIDNLKMLCSKILEPVVDIVGDLRVDSGFRCVLLNKRVGGVSNSQHCLGQAVDFVPMSCSLKDAYIKIINSIIPFDQAILEFNSWIHISYSQNPRKNKLTSSKVNGKTVYSVYK